MHPDSHETPGSRWGFINGSTPEIWTPAPGLYHFGLITTPSTPNNALTVVVTYSDGTTGMETALEPNVTTWIGFHEAGKTITEIEMVDVPGGSFANYDDVSLVFVLEPSTSVLMALALVGLCGYRKRQYPAVC